MIIIDDDINPQKLFGLLEFSFFEDQDGLQT
jgi:hypothetical protein